MKKIWTRKDSGMLEQILPVFVGIFILTMVFVLMLGAMESIQTKNKVDLVARRAILLLETYGYIEDSMKQELLEQLAECNVTNAVIETNGYASDTQSWGTISGDNPAIYGQKVEVVITGTTKMLAKTSSGSNVFSTIFGQEELPIRAVRVSTSKN